MPSQKRTARSANGQDPPRFHRHAVPSLLPPRPERTRDARPCCRARREDPRHPAVDGPGQPTARSNRAAAGSNPGTEPTQPIEGRLPWFAQKDFLRLRTRDLAMPWAPFYPAQTRREKPPSTGDSRRGPSSVLAASRSPTLPHPSDNARIGRPVRHWDIRREMHPGNSKSATLGTKPRLARHWPALARRRRRRIWNAARPPTTAMDPQVKASGTCAQKENSSLLALRELRNEAMGVLALTLGRGPVHRDGVAAPRGSLTCSAELCGEPRSLPLCRRWP